jgi:hypothetical protein
MRKMPDRPAVRNTKKGRRENGRTLAEKRATSAADGSNASAAVRKTMEIDGHG